MPSSRMALWRSSLPQLGLPQFPSSTLTLGPLREVHLQPTPPPACCSSSSCPICPLCTYFSVLAPFSLGQGGDSWLGSSEGRCAGSLSSPAHPCPHLFLDRGQFPPVQGSRQEALRVGLETNQPDGSLDNPAECSHPAQVRRHLPPEEESGQHLLSRPSAALTRA